MKISTSGRYGLRAMIELAKHKEDSYMPLSSIAEKQDLSINYLEHAFASLKKAGLVAGRAGVNGGYRLIDDPENITVKMILTTLEGEFSIADAVSQKEDTPVKRCVREHIWEEINKNINSLLFRTTLAEMVKRSEDTDSIICPFY